MGQHFWAFWGEDTFLWIKDCAYSEMFQSKLQWIWERKMKER